MKNLKHIIAQITSLLPGPSDELDQLIWQFICYPPKMPLRLHQEQLLAEADRFQLTVCDQYFSGRDLGFNGFKWGNGKHKILVTHGWGSKAADMGDLINALLQIFDVQVIAFDAPGNGSSEGELSNLLLFVGAIKATIAYCGEPEVVIGHSIGAMANVIALNDLGIQPILLASITPLMRLKENFEASMAAIGVPTPIQHEFLQSFQVKFGMQASGFNMNDKYQFNDQLNHWLVYDQLDQVSPYPYIADFLAKHPYIKTLQVDGAGHDRILRSAPMIAGLISEVKTAIDTASK